MSEIIKVKNGSYYEVAIGESKSGHIAACRVGGGFVFEIPEADVVERNATMPVNYQHAMVGFDGEPYVEAYFNPLVRWARCRE